MSFNDNIVLFYSLNTELFLANTSSLPKIPLSSLFQYQKSLNFAYLVTTSLTLPETQCLQTTMLVMYQNKFSTYSFMFEHF